MGGMFSGRKYWTTSNRKKRFTCELPSLDSLQINKALKTAEQNFCLPNFGRWNLFKLSFQNIEEIKVIYLVGYGKHEGQSFSSTLDYTTCFYGGSRCWLKCNFCEKRVRFLYYQYRSSFGTLACRLCHDLAYQSQSRSFSDRIMDKRRKIWGKLKRENGSFFRPKGMHLSTYLKLNCVENELEDIYMRAFFLKSRSYRDVKKISYSSAIAAFKKIKFPLLRKMALYGTCSFDL